MRRDTHRHGDRRRGERGSTLIEFTIGALVFLTASFAVFEFARLLWTHNALSDAARLGARFAVLQTNPADGIAEALPLDPEAVKNVVVYGNPEGTGNPVVNGLTRDNVTVEYTDSPVTGYFSYPKGSVTVGITDFEFDFVVPIVGTTISMPEYRTTLTSESAGIIPPDVGAPTPTPEPTATPAPSPTPSATPTPAPTATPTPAPTATPTPAPSPTPRACKKNESLSTGCACNPPMKVAGDKCH